MGVMFFMLFYVLAYDLFVFAYYYVVPLLWLLLVFVFRFWFWFSLVLVLMYLFMGYCQLGYYSHPRNKLTQLLTPPLPHSLASSHLPEAIHDLHYLFSCVLPESISDWNRFKILLLYSLDYCCKALHNYRENSNKYIDGC